MEKPHRPTLEELEQLFGDDTTPLYITPSDSYKPPASPEERLRAAARMFLYAWDDDYPIRALSPFVEALRNALDGRT